MKKLLAAALFLLLAPLHAAEEKGPAGIADALKLAGQQHRPVLIDFQAVWCYSCYYMASHVLNGPEWKALQDKAIFVEADADSPEGQQWMQQLKITFLPSYVVLDEHGEELGRILAEQPRQKFYPAINAILAHGNTLDTLQAKATAGSREAITAVLKAYQARNDGAAGLAWFATLPPALRGAAAKDAGTALALERLHLAQAKAAKDEPAVVASARKALAGPIGCDRPYVLEDLLAASEKLPAAQRRSLLDAQRKPLDDYLASQIFIAQPACADQRSAVLGSADLDAALGDSAAEKAVLDRAIALTRQRLGNHPASDRNLADNLRVYLARAKRTDELDAFQRQLIAAYPDDYVYAYRYGRSLLEAGKPAEALPWLEQAAGKAYGVNRLSVAAVRVKALKALHRQADAEKLVADTLKENGPWFPRQAALLKATLSS
ncbi:thioredoxin family protein [Frateuria defendens]|uniref:thioredoxin family protein n=1 Tax=Frateuria defendens TaxID=2219559 RepID=UPI00066FDD28|nr:thioredoxin family protein [Frateuria defendens]